MNDRKIITEKELNVIETLYLYCNVEDFINTLNLNDYVLSDDISPAIAYEKFMNYYKDYLVDNSKYLGFSKGRDWYQFNNYRLGIMSYDTARKANQFNCVIQYEWHYMYSLDKDLSNIVLPFEQDFKKYHIKRIDITKIAKVNTDYTVNHNYISPFRRKDNVNGTIYLGHRKNGNVFRMYNKTKELLTDTKEHPINHTKIDILSRYFGDIEDLYTFELELSRSYLKEVLGIQTLEDLPKVYKAYKNIVGAIRFYKDNDRNKRLIANNHHDRVSCKRLTDFVDYDRLEKKRYKPSIDYAIEKIIRVADQYIDSSKLERSNDNYMEFVNALLLRRLNYDNKDVVLSFEDTALSDEIDQMRIKLSLMRDNQSNELEIEADRYFGT